MASHALVFLTAALVLTNFAASQTDLAKYFDIAWGGGRGQFLDNGRVLTLSLDKTSGSGFESKGLFLLGRIDMQIKLVPKNSAGTVTAYFLKAPGSTWDEIDFEFLGNLTGDPYTVHTNVYGSGIGGREQQFRLWFDPTTDFHSYSILWNPLQIVFYVDGVPIRQFRNMENKGVAFPMRNPMRLYSSLWNADEWATRGGQVKTDWSQAPFRASYRNFVANACVWANGKSHCSPNNQWLTQQLDKASLLKLNWVKANHMIYNYCTDRVRFPKGFPAECYYN